MIAAIFMASCVNEKVVFMKETSESKVELDPKVENNRQYVIKTQIYKNDNVWACPQVTVIEKQNAVIKLVEERFIPKEWSTPKVESMEKSRTYIPATPVFKEPTEFGIILKISAHGTETLNSKKWVHLKGELICREGESSKTVPKDKIEALNDYAYSHSTDVSVCSLFLKDKSTKEWKFISGKNNYKVKFEISEITRKS